MSITTPSKQHSPSANDRAWASQIASATHTLRRYSEELDKRRREFTGDAE